MNVVLVSLMLSILAVDLVLAKNSTNIPDWVRQQLRRSRRRQNAPNCNAFSYKRCLHGLCLLAPTSKPYPDTADSFVNAKSKVDFYCECSAGYETYYPNEKDTAVPPDNQNSPFCNAQQDPCRRNPELCKTKSSLSKCIHIGPNDFDCQCTPFWKGVLCDQDVDECYPCVHSDETACPCKNSATCHNAKESDDHPLGFNCQCKSGTSGQFCEKITDPCAREPCVSKANFGGAMDDAKKGCTKLEQNELFLSKPQTLSGYECQCQDYWGGQNCEMRKGSCRTDPDPCDGKGQCIDDPNHPNYYKCLCSKGYENVVEDLNKGADGKFCTKQTDMCSPYNPCRNGATCLTLGPNERKCVCKPGYVGPYCEGIKNPCYAPGKKLCLNGGICNVKENSGVEFTCGCGGTGYEGDVCQNNINECTKSLDPQKCSNGNGKCIDKVGSFECKCDPGYINTAEDKTCKNVESLCDLEPNICQFEGLCKKINSIGGNFQCECPFVKVGAAQVMHSGTDSRICDAAKTNSEPQPSLGQKVDVDVSSIKDFGSAFKTRSGGVLGNHYWLFEYGSAKLTAPTTGILPGNMILYFRTSTPTEANLLTVWQPASGAVKGKKVLEIVPSPSRRNFLVKFLTPVLEIVLPRHSLKGWNNILIRTKDEIPAEGSSAKVSAKVEVYLNTAFIESKDVTTLPTIEKTAEIYFGTDLDSNGAETGPKFSGGIGDLFYFSRQPTTVESLKDNLLKLNSPNCKPYLNLEFEQPDIYRDSGCLMLDAIPVLEEMRSSLVKAPNGQFPLVFFQSHIDVPFMKKYLKPLDSGHMRVPSFPTLFNFDDSSYGMLFRFRLNFDGLKVETEKAKEYKVFARSKFVDGGDDSTNSLRVGTRVDNNNNNKIFYFKICLKTTLEYKCAESVLDIDFSADDFCKECVWSVAVNWNKIIDKDGASEENLEISNLLEGKIKKTSYTIKGKLSPVLGSALEIGVDRAHEVGPMRILAGKTFTQQETMDWLNSKGKQQ